MKKLLIYFILALMLAGCGELKGENGTNGNDGINGQDGINGGWDDATTDTPFVKTYNLTGKLQKGPCPEGGEVLIQPLNPENMYQKGGHYIGFTRDNFGRYYIPAEIEKDSTDDVWAETFFKGECHNELTAAFDYQEFSSIINIEDDENNINPLGHVRSFVARWLFGDPLITQIYGDPNSGTEGDIPASIALAEIVIIDFLQMPSPGKKFTEMNLENADIGDAILALFNSMVLYEGIGDHGDFLTRFSIGVIENDLEMKASIQVVFGVLPILDIITNLSDRYLELGEDIPPPPIWKLGAPDYYTRLIEEEQVIQGSFNPEDSAQCSMDMGYKRYAIPHIIESWFETSKYLASNLAENVSIWSRGVHGGGYDAPGIKLLDITELRERLLDSSLSFHGMLGDHNLKTGDEVYFVLESETAFVLSVGCDGGLLPWGRKIASNDSGVTYIGHDNSTTFFRKSGLKFTGID